MFSPSITTASVGVLHAFIASMPGVVWTLSVSIISASRHVCALCGVIDTVVSSRAAITRAMASRHGWVAPGLVALCSSDIVPLFSPYVEAGSPGGWPVGKVPRHFPQCLPADPSSMSRRAGDTWRSEKYISVQKGYFWICIVVTLEVIKKFVNFVCLSQCWTSARPEMRKCTYYYQCYIHLCFKQLDGNPPYDVREMPINGWNWLCTLIAHCQCNTSLL